MIVIHIGLRKAGSTSLQAFLSANADRLLGLGVDYPLISGPSSNHVNIAAEVRGRKNFDPARGALADLAAHRRADRRPTLVLSAEAFEECEPDQAARLREALGRPAEPFRIVLVLRDLVDLVPSSYAQMVKTGRKSHDFDTFFARRIGERRMNYSDAAARWAEAFGWESLYIRLLDRAHLVGGDLIDDFLTILGLDPAVAGKRLRRTAEANVTPGWRVVEAVRALHGGKARLAAGHRLNGAGALNADARQRIGRLAIGVGEDLGWNADRGRYLTRFQAQWCVELHAEAVEALNARLGQWQGGALPLPADLESRGFVERAALPSADLIAPRELAKFYDELGARAAEKLEALA